MYQGPIKPLNFLRLSLNMVAFINDATYTIQGRTRWSMLYREYFEDDNKKGYKNGTWEYDEWCLKKIDGEEYLFLIEDKEGYQLAQEIQPEFRQFVPIKECETTSGHFYHSHDYCRIIEYGQAEIIYKEGESDLKPSSPSKKYFFKYKWENFFYIAETPLYPDDELIPEESSYFEERVIGSKEFKSIFRAEGTIQEKIRRIVAIAKVRTLFWYVFLLSFASYLLSIYMYETIYIEKINLKNLNDTIPYTTKTWEIDSKNRLHQYELNLILDSYSGNITEVFVTADFFDKGSELLTGQLEGDFYEETGVDSDGKWTENNLNSYQYLNSDSTGKFYAEIYAEIMPNTKTSGSVELVIKKYFIYWYYVLILSITSLVLCIIFQIVLVQIDRTYF